MGRYVERVFTGIQIVRWEVNSQFKWDVQCRTDTLSMSRKSSASIQDRLRAAKGACPVEYERNVRDIP